MDIPNKLNQNNFMNTVVKPRRVAMLAYNNAGLLDITGLLDLFSGASCLLPRTENNFAAYQLEIVAKSKGKISTSSGVDLIAKTKYNDVDCAEIDTLIIAGGLGFESALTEVSRFSLCDHAQ